MLYDQDKVEGKEKYRADVYLINFVNIVPKNDSL